MHRNLTKLPNCKMTDIFIIIFISILRILFFFPGIFCISEEHWGNSSTENFLSRPTRKSPGCNIKEELMQLWTVFLSRWSLYNWYLMLSIIKTKTDTCQADYNPSLRKYKSHNGWRSFNLHQSGCSLGLINKILKLRQFLFSRETSE